MHQDVRVHGTEDDARRDDVDDVEDADEEDLLFELVDDDKLIRSTTLPTRDDFDRS